MSRITFGIAILLLGVMLSACGSEPTPVPQPQPAPAPQNNGGQFFGGGGNCGAPGGQPFTQNGTPYIANISSTQFNSVSSNSISLHLGFQNFAGVGQPTYNVLGSAQLVWPDLIYIDQALTGRQFQGQFPTSFCVTSNSLQGGQPFPGLYAPQTQSVAIDLQGLAQVPLHSAYGQPYNQQGGVQQLVQVPVTVAIGLQGCPAYLSQGRLYGCMSIFMGNQYYYYQMQ